MTRLELRHWITVAVVLAAGGMLLVGELAPRPAPPRTITPDTALAQTTTSTPTP